MWREGSKQKRRSEATSSLAEIETLRADRRWIARGRGSSCPSAKATTANVRLGEGTSVLLLTLSRTRILGNPSPSCGPRSSSQMPTGLCPLGLTPDAVSDRPPVSTRRAGSCVAGRGTQLDCRRPDQPRLETGAGGSFISTLCMSKGVEGGLEAEEEIRSYVFPGGDRNTEG